MINHVSKKIKTNRLRILWYILTIMLGFLLETSIFPLIPFLGATPNILLIMTFTVGYIKGNVPGMLYGLGSGLLLDLFYSGPFGFYSLVFIIIGYVTGFFHHWFYEEYISLPMMICLISELIYHFYIYVFRFLVRMKFNLLYYTLHIILPSVIFSLLVTLILYRFFFSAAKAGENGRRRL